MKPSRLVAVGLVAIVVAALLWLVGGNAYARHRERQVERAWEQSFGTRQSLLDRYPKTATNETARRLEELAKPLGLDLTPKTHEAVTAEAVASSKSPSADASARRAVSEYLTAQLERPDSSIDAPPPEVKTFLAGHEAALLEVEEELLTSPPPSWDVGSASLHDRSAIPNVYGLIGLQRTLLAQALAISDRNAEEAKRSLEASWRLNQTLRDVPDISSQLIALAVTRLQAGTLRKVEVDEAVWRARLVEHDFKQSVFDTQLLGLWPSADRYRRLEEIENRLETSALKRLKNKFEEPYANIVWLKALEKMRSAYLRIRDLPVMSKELWDETHGPEKNASDILVAIQMPNMVDCFKRVDRLVIESELTDKVLQVRQVRRENNLKWPPTVPGIEATRFPGAHWIYSVSPQGTMSLSLSKEPNWQASGVVLPTRFTAS